MQEYGPLKLANILWRKGILSPFHSYLIKTLEQVSTSYQSSKLFEFLNVDFINLSKYNKFKEYVKHELHLMRVYLFMEKKGNNFKD